MATTFGPNCPQLKSDTGEIVGDEDCLTLNVWAPDGVTHAPVMFFIHGGGNTIGAASDPMYDGADLEKRTGSIVVTVEYRLGALGFFAHAGLNAESADGVSGNYGILDQIAALQWVKTNITSFGGDPAHVLVFGESAGGQDTQIHIASPRSAGLLSSAIVESGGTYKTTLADGIKALAPVIATVGCASAADQVACMRAVPVASLVAVPTVSNPIDTGLHYTPLVDGVILPDNSAAMINRGEHNHIPFIIGSNASETSRMVPMVSTAEEYTSLVRGSYGQVLGDQLLALYPAASFPSPRAALIKLTTDVLWTCPTRRVARDAATTQTEPVFRYFFSWHLPGQTGTAVGATHGLELPFVFRSFSALSSTYVPTAQDQALSDAVQGYWSRLAPGGTPNGGSALAWPAYEADSDAFMKLDATLAAGDGIATTQCDAMDSLLGL